MSSPGRPTDSPPQNEPAADLGSRLAILSVASALFMQFLDSSALATALPVLAASFGADPIHTKLALTAYILSQAVFLPASGWAADRFGPRRVFLTAMAVFLVGSVLCGFSRSLGELVAFRIVQGLGGALMVPVARVIVLGSTPKHRFVQAMAWLSTPAMAGPLLGPPLAGLVLSVTDWPWIFFINVPVGLLGMAAVLRWAPRIARPHPGAFDMRGFLIAAAFIAAAMIGAETTGLDILPAAAVWAAWGAALVMGAAYWRHARSRPRPVLDLSLLRYATFRANQVGGTLVRMGVGASPFLLPLLFQGALGWSPLKTGLITVASGLGALLVRPFAPRMVRRFGFRPMLVASAVAAGVLGACPALFGPQTPEPLIFAVLGMTGFARAVQFSSANTLAYADTPDDAVSAASTLTAVGQQLALALGITVGGVLLHLTQGGGGAALEPRHFTLPFLVVGLLPILSLPVYLALPREAGANLRGERR